MGLPHDVRLTALATHRDGRGALTEIFRDEWALGLAPCQWNVSTTEPNVLRGVHVHYKHQDYLVVASGRLSVGLLDIRPHSPTYLASALIELGGDRLAGLSVP